MLPAAHIAGSAATVGACTKQFLKQELAAVPAPEQMRGPSQGWARFLQKKECLAVVPVVRWSKLTAVAGSTPHAASASEASVGAASKRLLDLLQREEHDLQGHREEEAGWS